MTSSTPAPPPKIENFIVNLDFLRGVNVYTIDGDTYTYTHVSSTPDPDDDSSPSTLVEDDPLGLLCERCLEGELRRGGGTAVQPRLENAGERRERMALLARIRMFVDSPRAMGVYRRLFEFRWDKDVRDPDEGVSEWRRRRMTEVCHPFWY